MDGSFSKVGFPENGDAGTGSQVGSGRDESNDISEIIEIAAYLNFGTKNFKGWPFMGISFDENVDTIDKMKTVFYNKILDGTMSVEQALGLLGEFLTGKTKMKIVDIKTPANKKVTIARKKGVNNPLIDTAQMLNSVQHKETIK